MKRTLAALALALLSSFACGDDPAPAPGTPDGGGASSSSSGAAGGSSGASSGGAAAPGCRQTPQADDALRFVVAGRPYGELTDAGSATMEHRFSTFTLTSAGALAGLGEFELGGYNTSGRIAFTADGRLGAVALESRTQEDRGTVGLFRLDDAGQVTVVHANYKADFFASDAAFSPDGATLYVSDSNTSANGGGIYAVAVACDGTLGAATRITHSTGTTPPVWAPTGSAAPFRALVAADSLEGAPAAEGLHLFAFEGATATRVGGADAFGQQTLVQDIAWSPDGAHALLTAPNENVGGMRLLAVDIEGDAMALADEWPLPGVETVAASPYGNAYVVGTADPDGVFQVQSTGDGFRAPVAVTLSGPMAQLPFAASVVGRGALRGRVLMAELTGIRSSSSLPMAA